jgi:hypothetical protein
VPDTDDTLAWRGRDLHDSAGERIGVIEEIYLDAETGAAEWALVQTGMFGTTRTFVPLGGAEEAGDGIGVAVDRDAVRAAPSIDPDGQLSQAERDELRRHYGAGA